MKDVFTQLREELQSVDQWLEGHLELLLPAKERKLALMLRKYVYHCYRDTRKWRSESVAQRARLKLRDISMTLYLLEAERQS